MKCQYLGNHFRGELGTFIGMYIIVGYVVGLGHISRFERVELPDRHRQVDRRHVSAPSRGLEAVESRRALLATGVSLHSWRFQI